MPFGDTCYCSERLPRGEALEGRRDRDFNRPCTGLPNEFCGGRWNDGTPRVRLWKNPLESARTQYIVRGRVYLYDQL